MDLKKYIPWIGAGWGVTLLMNAIMFAVIGIYDITLWILLGMQTSTTLIRVVVGIYIVLVLLFTAVEFRMGKPYREQYKTAAAGNPVVKYVPWKDWSFGKIFACFLGSVCLRVSHRCYDPAVFRRQVYNSDSAENVAGDLD